jgi:hypothetical protein
VLRVGPGGQARIPQPASITRVYGDSISCHFKNGT